MGDKIGNVYKNRIAMDEFFSLLNDLQSILEFENQWSFGMKPIIFKLIDGWWICTKFVTVGALFSCAVFLHRYEYNSTK